MRLSDFSLLTGEDGADTSALLLRVNDTAMSYPRNATIPAIFAGEAAKRPDAIAIVCGDVELTYRDAERRSSRLAGFLLSQGLRREETVAIMLDRSTEAVVAMLATLKAGGAYCPIARDLPFERIRYMLTDSRAPILIAGRSQRGLVRQLRLECPQLRCALFLDDAAAGSEETHAREPMPGEWNSTALDAYPEDARIDLGLPNSMAYIIYTSGTSGVPKGVVVEHRSVLRLVLDTNYIALGPEDRILQTGSLAFDAATFEIWGALLNGGCVCLADSAVLLNARAMQRLISRHRITTMWLTAGLFNLLATDHVGIFAGLKTVLAGGERVSAHHFNLVRRAHPGLVLKNGYGPTENTTFTTCYTMRDGDEGDIPIGTPISNTTAHVLDDELEPVEPGVSAELYAGGDGLARGYLNAPALTAEKFVPDPRGKGKRLYRTGDLARWREDGQLEYIGRVDDQVKIRGNRIEPAEIGHRLLAIPGVKNATVIATIAADASTILVAYYTSDDASVGDDQLRGHLVRTLPDYMIPAQFVRLDAFPLTTNGKLDRRALPIPGRPVSGGSSAIPSTETEKELLTLWRRVLNANDASIDDNFFALGGHSLTAVRLANAIAEKFGIVLSFASILQAPTVRALAGLLLDSARFDVSAVDQPLVLLNEPADARPIFGFPPGTTDAISYSLLARHLSGRPLYAFNFIDEEAGFGRYADLIERADAEGPHVLFGYSGGGNMAFRVARELERRGRRVSAIIMLDASRFFEPYPIPVEEARRLAAEFLDSDDVTSIVSSPLLQDKVVRRIERYYAMLSTVPDIGTVAADIHVIASEDGPDSFHDETGRLICSKSGWGEATSGRFSMHRGAGDHSHMLHRQHIEPNAGLLRDILQAVHEKGAW